MMIFCEEDIPVFLDSTIIVYFKTSSPSLEIKGPFVTKENKQGLSIATFPKGTTEAEAFEGSKFERVYMIPLDSILLTEIINHEVSL